MIDIDVGAADARTMSMQIRALKAMTPVERVRALVVAANKLLELRKHVRRV